MIVVIDFVLLSSVQASCAQQCHLMACGLDCRVNGPTHTRVTFKNEQFVPHFTSLTFLLPILSCHHSYQDPPSTMLCFSHPPMFTSDGYQPSIFMDTSPRHACPERHPGPLHEQAFDTGPQDEPRARRVDYIQIWLNTHPLEAVQDAASGVMDGTLPAPTTPRETSVQVHEDDLDSQDDRMEWESCVSSFTSATADQDPVPELNQQVPPSSPELVVQPTGHPAVSESKPTTSFAFQKRMMLPTLPFQGRARCIFLASESSTDPRMHRSVTGLLHNTAVQRIRNWFKTTIEDCALEQWRNLSLLTHFSKLAAIAPTTGCDGLVSAGNECPICYKPGMVMKLIAACGHSICWKCEQHLNQTGNISCPMCRRIRLASSYKNVRDLFRTTIGLHLEDYTHPYCLTPSGEALDTLGLDALTLDEDEEDEEVEHELSDRYLWESSASFLGYLQSSKHHSLKQYFQLNAVQDLCSKPSTDQHLPEYNDQSILEPPLSGLVLPPHRLYSALIHFCLDMLTLPLPTEFQRRPQFKRETMLLELIILFLVPTDEFSPRNADRIYNAPAWIEQGQYILARIHRFIQTKMRQSMAEMNQDDNDDEHQEAVQQNVQQTGTARNHGPSSSIPSIPIPRHILYLGTSRWMWIAQSLTVLLTWIHAADLNPSMVTPTTKWTDGSVLGKHSLQKKRELPPAKRRCPDTGDDDDEEDDSEADNDT